MEFRTTVSTVETHAAGEPLRIVTAGVPRIPGESILAKRRWAREHLDGLRRALMHEPRGHADMYGCFLTEPVTAEADLGVIFLHNEGYSSMCGHGVIALATVAVAQGLVPRACPETRVGLDTPAGFVEAWVAWDGRRAGEVRFVNVPSFLYARDVTVATPGFGELTVDVAYGGAFYAYLDGRPLGLAVREENVRELIRLGDEVKRAVEARLDIVHPEEPELRGLYGTIVDGEPRHEGSSQANCCVFADREVDRSPTGTGTAGRVAQLVARGRLGLGEELVNESVIGTIFRGRALRRARVGDLDAVVPEVSGRAHITGFAQWVLEEGDPIAEGFFFR